MPSNEIELFPGWAEEEYEATKMPGAVVVVKDQKIKLNEGRKRVRVRVTSKGDRPIQVRTSISSVHKRERKGGRM